MSSESASFTKYFFEPKYPDLVNPSFLHVVTPSPDGLSSAFFVKVSGQALYLWKDCACAEIFYVLQENLVRLGYLLKDGARAQISKILRTQKSNLQKTFYRTNDARCRERTVTEDWSRIELSSHEISLGSQQILDEIAKDEQESRKQQSCETPDNAVSSRKPFHKLSSRQQNRNMKSSGKSFTFFLNWSNVFRTYCDVCFGSFAREKTEQALQFTERFGLVPDSISFKDLSGKRVEINLGKLRATHITDTVYAVFFWRLRIFFPFTRWWSQTIEWRNKRDRTRRR